MSLPEATGNVSLTDLNKITTYMYVHACLHAACLGVYGGGKTCIKSNRMLLVEFLEIKTIYFYIKEFTNSGR